MRSNQNKKGCLFYGCLTFSLIAIAVVVGTYFGMRKVMRTYTAEKPVQLPQSNFSHSEYQTLVTRLENFYTNRQEDATIELTADEINGLLAHTPDLKNIGQRFYFQIESNKVKAQVSFSLGDLGATQFKDRYINGVADINLKVTNGVVVAHATNFNINGNPMPDSLSAALQTQNLAGDLNKDPKMQQTLAQVERLEVKDGKVILELKKPEETKPAQP
ncbi:MAG: hypothetical protein ACO1QB_01160 [Verrucomicrobiales bacterium]